MSEREGKTIQREENEALLDDESIIELFFARSEKAISETDKKYGKKCLKLSRSIVGDGRDAEECVNDTYLAAWNAIPPERPRPLVAFLLKITRNLSLKRYRYNTAEKRNSRYDAPFDELSECIGNMDETVSAVETELTVQLLERFLDGLSTENRVIFLRRYWFSDSYEEIAERVGLSEKTVSMRLVRVREALKRFLNKEGVLI